MKTTVLALSLVLGLSILPAVSAAVPANDTIPKATMLKGGYARITGQNLSLATASPTDPLIGGASAGKTLWYSVPAPATSGFLILDFKSSTAAASATVFNVQDPDNPVSSLRQMTTTTLGAGGTARLTVSVFPTQPLLLMVAGSGVFELTHHFDRTSGGNDFPATAYELSGDKGTQFGHNDDASITSDEPATTGQFNTVWYKWTPSFSGKAFVDTNFSFVSGPPSINFQDHSPAHATMLSVYSVNPGDGSLVSLASDTDSGWDVNSRAGFNATAGATYYISVGTVTGSIAGQFQLNYYPGGTAGEIYFSNYFNLGTVMEGAGTFGLTVLRHYADDLAASCNLSTAAGGTALPGADYTAFTNHAVSFAASGDDAWVRTDSLAILNDSVAESDKTVRLSLSSPSANATLSVVPTGTLTIADDDHPTSGLFTAVTQFRVPESAGVLELVVQRYGPPSRDQILYQTQIGGNAVPNVDYSVGGTYLAASDQSTICQFFVQNDNVFNGDRTAVMRVAGSIDYTVVIEDDDPYIPVPGKLTAALTYARGARQAVLYATVSKLGVVTGKLIAVGQTLPFTGTLSARGKLSVPILAGTRPLFILSLAAQDEQGSFNIQLQDSGDLSVATATAMAQNFSAASPCPFKSPHTFATSSSGSTVDVSAAGTLVVDAAGNAVMAGKVFDGTAFTSTGYVDGLGSVSVMSSLYAGQGCFGMFGTLPSSAGSISNPTVIINRPARANDPAKMGALVDYTSGSIARYAAPPSGTRALEAWSGGTGSAIFSDGAVTTQFIRPLTITTSNAITAPNDAVKLKITLVSATGLFSGSFVPPGTTKTLTFNGALLQLPLLSGIGRGFFFNALPAGEIDIGPP